MDKGRDMGAANMRNVRWEWTVPAAVLAARGSGGGGNASVAGTHDGSFGGTVHSAPLSRNWSFATQ